MRLAIWYSGLPEPILGIDKSSVYRCSPRGDVVWKCWHQMPAWTISSPMSLWLRWANKSSFLLFFFNSKTSSFKETSSRISKDIIVTFNIQNYSHLLCRHASSWFRSSHVLVTPCTYWGLHSLHAMKTHHQVKRLTNFLRTWNHRSRPAFLWKENLLLGIYQRPWKVRKIFLHC